MESRAIFSNNQTADSIAGDHLEPQELLREPNSVHVPEESKTHEEAKVATPQPELPDSTIKDIF
jgi:hypothetical protein